MSEQLWGDRVFRRLRPNGCAHESHRWDLRELVDSKINKRGIASTIHKAEKIAKSPDQPNQGKAGGFALG